MIDPYQPLENMRICVTLLQMIDLTVTVPSMDKMPIPHLFDFKNLAPFGYPMIKITKKTASNSISGNII
jgi:hypothetical protein